MCSERLLFVAGWNLLHGLNHRSQHMAAFLQQRFKHIDLVGCENFYSGPPASPWCKARQGISDLLHCRTKVSERGSARQIVIRDLFAPPPLDLLVKDLWRYVCLRQAIRLPYDLAIFGHPQNAWLAWLLKRSGRVKLLIYDDWDYFPGLEGSRVSRRLMESREQLCIRQADAVFSVNSLLAQRRVHQGARQVLVVPNGVDFSLFAPARHKMPHPPTLVYTGTLSRLWAIDLAIRAMPTLLRSIPDARLLIVGLGDAESELRALSEALSVAGHVTFLGPVEYHALPAILAQADVGIATSLPSSQFRRYASPLKLIDYMAAGLPVIASRVGQTEMIMQQSGAGILIDHSVEGFVAATVSLLSDRELHEQCSEAAVSYAARFDWSLLLDQAYQHLRRMIADNQVSGAASGPVDSVEEAPGDMQPSRIASTSNTSALGKAGTVSVTSARLR